MCSSKIVGRGRLLLAVVFAVGSRRSGPLGNAINAVGTFSEPTRELSQKKDPKAWAANKSLMFTPNPAIMKEA